MPSVDALGAGAIEPSSPKRSPGQLGQPGYRDLHIMFIDLRTKHGICWSTGSSTSIDHVIMTTNFGAKTFLDLCKNNEMDGLSNYIWEQGQTMPT